MEGGNRETFSPRRLLEGGCVHGGKGSRWVEGGKGDGEKREKEGAPNKDEWAVVHT